MRVSGQGSAAANKQTQIDSDRTESDSEKPIKVIGPVKRPVLNTPQKDATKDEIRDLTGNSNTDAYDPTIAGKAVREGTTYNQAVTSTNVINALTGVPERFEPVREMPWESKAVNGRVDTLMREENLSFEGAVTIAMTERPQQTTIGEAVADVAADINGQAPSEGDWEESFSQMVSDSSVEIAAWADNQPADSTASFGATSDDISVFMRDDMIVVSDGVTEQEFNPAEHDRIVIAAGGGDDKITVDPAVTENLMIVGGDGDDTVFGGNGNNIIIGGDGNDNLEGGKSNDLIIGGAGRDSVYGGGGADTIDGGADGDALYGGDGKDFIVGGDGDDYIDGGRGNDSLRGDDGSDTISGGFGRDKIRGGTGDDTMIGASGTDLYADVEAGDMVIAEDDETFAANGATVNRVDIDNSAGLASVSVDPTARDNFNQRVQDDLQTMRSLESGQAMLNALDTEFNTLGHTTVIRERTTEGGSASTVGAGDRFLQADGTRGSGMSTAINYNPHFNTSAHPTPFVPIVVLFHEFAHAYHNASGQTVNGTYNSPGDPDHGLNLRELQAAGIRIDHDNDPTTPDQFVNPTGHPFELTENGIREELGLPSRDQYRN